ncbi:hypothetical protein KI688_003557 [Linnemannia hyalina]|uniref:Uncharacterized protein n=1 Tax=Linnemannia hyalina TaxID=64524 RepID=A0A9P7XP07_9FUNG|nr:hypothetical protein KI688_003557 [Linnemannia hyalina]
MAIGIAIDLHRIHIAVYKSSTRSTQFAFNLWLIGAAAFYFVFIYGAILDYFIQFSKVGIVTNNNSTVETATMITPDQHDQPLSSSSLQTTTPQMWEETKYYIDCGLHLVLGLGLKAILNQRRQLDLEREEQQHHHLYHHLLVSSDKGLPTPIASASSVEGFKTEVELGRLRLRVPTWPRFFVAIWFLWSIYDGAHHVSHFASAHRLSVREYAQLAISLTQSITGLYILYRKSLVMTQWLFYSLCVTAVYQTISANIGFWNEDLKKNFAELAETIENDEGGGASLKDFADKTDEEILLMRVLYMTGATLFYLGRLWVAWRLVADLKARNARVARAVGLI